MDTQTQTRITALAPEDLEDFFLVLPRILCDYRCPTRGPFMLGYIYANTKDNEVSSFLRAIKLARAGDIQSLGISEGDKGFGYEGFDHSVERLHAYGWKDEWKIPIIKFDVDGNVNTGSEARKLIDYLVPSAGTGRPNDCCVIAPPFHIVRAFMTTVTAIERYQTPLPLRVYAAPGIPIAWNERATHSQGTVAGTRAELVKGELQRLERYRGAEFGSMLTPAEVITYLNWRDGVY